MTSVKVGTSWRVVRQLAAQVSGSRKSIVQTFARVSGAWQRVYPVFRNRSMSSTGDFSGYLMWDNGNSLMPHNLTVNPLYEYGWNGSSYPAVRTIYNGSCFPMATSGMGDTRRAWASVGSTYRCFKQDPSTLVWSQEASITPTYTLTGTYTDYGGSIASDEGLFLLSYVSSTLNVFELMRPNGTKTVVATETRETGYPASSAISGDGNVIAYITGNSAAQVKVGVWNGSTYVFSALTTVAFSAGSLALNYDGTVLAIGENSYTPGSGTPGRVRVYSGDTPGSYSQNTSVNGSASQRLGRFVTCNAGGTMIGADLETAGSNGDGYETWYFYKGSNSLVSTGFGSGRVQKNADILTSTVVKTLEEA